MKKNPKPFFHLETKIFNLNRNQEWLGYSDTITLAFTNTTPTNISYGKFLPRQKLLNFAPSDKDFVRQKFRLMKGIDLSESQTTFYLSAEFKLQRKDKKGRRACST